MFLDEIIFFGFDVSMLCNCCWYEIFEVVYERLIKRCDEKRVVDKEVVGGIYVFLLGVSFREKIWKILEEFFCFFVVKMFYFVSVFVIVVSVVVNIIEIIVCKGVFWIC